MDRTCVLLYQAGIANVFTVDRGAHLKNPEDRTGQKRLLQGSFRECEAFARGMDAAGMLVYSFHCNMAGDVAGQVWEASLDEAPFRESMRPVGSYVDPIQV